jgi:hypothetical protein
VLDARIAEAERILAPVVLDDASSAMKPPPSGSGSNGRRERRYPFSVRAT